MLRVCYMRHLTAISSALGSAITIQPMHLCWGCFLLMTQSVTCGLHGSVHATVPGNDTPDPSDPWHSTRQGASGCQFPAKELGGGLDLFKIINVL